MPQSTFSTQPQDPLHEILWWLTDPHSRAFVLKGAAGTGKTTFVKALLKELNDDHRAFKLAAPTGRAARVLATKTQEEVTTVHSMVFDTKEEDTDDTEDKDWLQLVCTPKTEYSTIDTLYIIDEASMVAAQAREEGLFQSEYALLEALVLFVEKGAKGNKILFIGDPYQLPPVQEDKSLALDVEFLNDTFWLQAKEMELTTVYRQAEGGELLAYATSLRDQICMQQQTPARLKVSNFPDYQAAVRYYTQHFDAGKLSNITFLAWRNKEVNLLNRLCRASLFGLQAEELVAGDLLVLGQTHYQNQEQSIASGELMLVKEILIPYHLEADIPFAKVRLELATLSGKTYLLDTWLNIKYLKSETGTFEFKDYLRLLKHRMGKNKLLKLTKKKLDDAFLSAMLPRFGYALTCHKAQGGEWKEVIIHPRIPFTYQANRWLYTAVTRAKNKVWSFC